MNKNRLVYGITHIKVQRPVTVKFEFSKSSLLYINGKIVGTTLPRGQWGFVRLAEGENKIEMIMSPKEMDKWSIGLPSITWIGDPGSIAL